MSERIKRIFEKKEKKLVTFTTGGDPDLETSFSILKTIISNKINIVVMNMCGRGDKDIFTIAEELNIKL